MIGCCHKMRKCNTLPPTSAWQKSAFIINSQFRRIELHSAQHCSEIDCFALTTKMF